MLRSTHPSVLNKIESAGIVRGMSNDQLYINPASVQEQRNRVATATARAAREAQGRAARIPDVSFPPGLADVGAAMTRMRGSVCVALGTLAERSEAFGSRVDAVLSVFVRVDEVVAKRISDLANEVNL